MSSNSVEVRPARDSDREAVLALIPRLRAFGPSPLRTPAALDAGERRTLERFFDAPSDDARLWVAIGPGEELFGAAYAEPAADYFTQELYGHLGILAVSTRAEGHGVGRALIAVVEEWATERNYRFLNLNVFASNERAIAFYESAGYRRDTMVYVKELPVLEARDKN